MFVLIFLLNAKAQTMESVPVQFGQFYNAYSIVNPASAGSTGHAELQAGRQMHGGMWRNISTTYASAAFRLNPSIEKNNFQVLGFSFVGDKEGEYLKRSKFYATYGWHTKLTAQLSLGAGASIGLFSYLVSGSNASVAGSALAPDGSIGLWLYHQRYYLGASACQLFNSRLTPLQETTRLVPHYNITGGYSFIPSASFSIIPRTMIRYIPGYPLDVDVSVAGVIDEIITAGVNYRHQRSMVYMVGLERLKVIRGKFRFMFSYAVPTGSVFNNIHTYELTLNYESTKRKN